MELWNQPTLLLIWTEDTYPEDWRGGITSFPGSIQVTPHHSLPECVSQAQTTSSDKKHLHCKFLTAQFLHWDQDSAFLGTPENVCTDRLKNSNKLLSPIRNIKNRYEKTVILLSIDAVLTSRTSWAEFVSIQYFHEDGVISGDFTKRKELSDTSTVSKTVIPKCMSSTHYCTC